MTIQYIKLYMHVHVYIGYACTCIYISGDYTVYICVPGDDYTVYMHLHVYIGYACPIHTWGQLQCNVVYYLLLRSKSVYYYHLKNQYITITLKISILLSPYKSVYYYYLINQYITITL